MGRKRASVLGSESSESLSKQGGLIETPLERKKHMAPVEFWRFTTDYPDKAAVAFYVYRLWPRIQRVKPKQKNILKAVELSEEELRKRFGSGTYQVMFVDSNKPRAGVEAKIQINDPQLDPVIELDDLDTGHPENRAYVEGLRARGLLPAEGETMGQDTTAGVAVKEAVELARDAMRQSNARPAESETATLTKAMETLQSIQDRVAKANQPIDVLALAEKLRALFQPAGDSGSAALVSKLIEQNNALMLRLMERQNPEPSDPLEHLERAASLLDRFGSGRRGGGSSGGFDWGTVLQAAPAILAGLQQLQARAVAPAPVGVTVPVEVPTAVAVSLPAPSPAPVPSDEVQIPEELMNLLQLAGLSPAQINGLARVGRLARESFERGCSGDNFAHALCSDVLMPEGETLYQVLCQIGREQVSALLPKLGFSVATERSAELAEFLKEFFDYEKDLKAGEGNNAS